MSVTLLPRDGLTDTQWTAASNEPSPSLTYRVDWAEGTDAVNGHTDGLAAMRQAVFKYLQTQRNRYPIYDRDYGIETHDLIGHEHAYVQALIEGRVMDALSVDDRVVSVDGFAFTHTGGDELLCSFTVHTVFGDIQGQVSV